MLLPQTTESLSSDSLGSHRFANLFPAPTEAQIASMTESIRAVGQQEPIITHEGKILDGRIRDAACQRLEVKPWIEPFKGSDALMFVIARNIPRRHLTTSQRAMVGAGAATLAVGDNQHSEGLPIGRCSELFGVSQRAIARAKVVRQYGVPELIDAVINRQLAVAKAVSIAKLPKEQQSRSLAALSILGRAPAATKRSGRPNRSSRPTMPSLPLSRGQQTLVDELTERWDEADVLARESFLKYALKGLNHLERILTQLEVVGTPSPETETTACKSSGQTTSRQADVGGVS
ncbi:MAG: ParB/RepB/Spo0J family partition protein [Xanthobacteraceae bacterium]|nr:ParB/RepB/Spo0J family partition protein [Xanthobacteraceae bacterium]